MVPFLSRMRNNPRLGSVPRQPSGQPERQPKYQFAPIPHEKAPLLAIAGSILAPLTPCHAGAIASGDLLIFQAGTSSLAASNTASQLVIDEIDPALTGQTSPVQSFDISTMGSPLFTDSEGSVGDLSLSDNGTLLSFSGWTAANGSSAENAILSRGAGTLDSNGNYTLAATYTGVTGNQPRSAYSPDDLNWYFGDKGGVYTAGASSPFASSPNMRTLAGISGTTYGLVATSGSTVVGSITPATPNGSSFSYTGLPGLPSDSNAVGFALAISGTQDTLYFADNKSGSPNFIDKYTFIGSSWVSSGSMSIGSQINVDQLIAEPVSGGNVDIFFTGDPSSGHGNAQVDELVDTLGFDGTIALSGSTNIYTAPSGDTLQGIAFAPVPVPEPGAWGAVLIAIGVLVVFQRVRRRSRQI